MRWALQQGGGRWRASCDQMGCSNIYPFWLSAAAGPRRAKLPGPPPLPPDGHPNKLVFAAHGSWSLQRMEHGSWSLQRMEVGLCSAWKLVFAAHGTCRNAAVIYLGCWLHHVSMSRHLIRSTSPSRILCACSLLHTLMYTQQLKREMAWAPDTSATSSLL